MMMRRTPAGETFTEIVTIGLNVSALLEQAGEVLTAPEGQSAARWKVLGVVSKHQMTVAEIARTLRQSRQGVQKVADALAEMAVPYTSTIRVIVVRNFWYSPIKEKLFYPAYRPGSVLGRTGSAQSF
jgi:hypothetical protein